MWQTTSIELGLKRTRNAVYQTTYHAVWIPKYRRALLVGAVARTLFAEFPALRRRLRRGHLWAPSFYVGTAGQFSADTIRRYIERTEHVRPGR